ncbi:MAG: hypothetical protein HY012_04355 [Acidobacteria bacterium]|nr:hypothetical protein [Acidobacteriota bacterium]
MRKIHPSKIPPQQFQNAKFCAACHKSVQGKFTHSAIQATGCVSCHDLKTQDDQTVTSLVERGNALCLTCHSDKSSAETKGRMHSPVAEGECTTCHNPHSSANKNLLIQPTSGGPSENLCLTCHDTGVQVAAKGSRHAALDLGCDTCHVTHKTGDAGQQEFAFHLSASVPDLCLTCHDAAGPEIKKAHANQPITKTNCTSCHNPHAGESAKLTYGFAHPPFAERQCDACHEAPKDNKIALVEGGGRALCYLCHDAIQSQIASAKQVHGVFKQADTCTNCHSPHATAYPQHLKQPLVALCESCHAQQAEQQTTKKFLHPPAFQAGCTVCHEPHASDYAGRLRAGINELCMSCHASDAQGEASSDPKNLVLFGGTVRLPGDYLASVKRLPLRKGAVAGHPMANHPVEGKADPSNPEKPLTCVACHNPHAGNGSQRMFVTETRSSSPLCIRCHK